MSKTILLGYFSRFWAVLLSFLLTPIYIKIIGIESFAIVGLTFSIQAIFFFLDFGFGTATVFETSELYAQKKYKELVDLFRTGGIAYWVFALFLFFLFVSGSKVVTVLWLSQVPCNVFNLHLIIPLMGGVILSQWPTLFYVGALWGLQRQDVVNRLNLMIATFKGALTIGFLIFISPTIESFLAANIIVGLLHSLGAAFYVRKFIKDTRLTSKFDVQKFSLIAKKSLKFSALSVMSILLIHIDKAVLSRFLDLNHFGYYSVCWILIYGMYGFCSTLPAYFSPRFSYLAALNDERGLVETYHQGCQCMSVLAISGSLFFIFFARQILTFWTRDPVLAENTYLLSSFLIAGSCLHVLSTIPQSFQVAKRWTSLTIACQAISIAAWVALLIVMVHAFGVIGAGISWVVLHFIYLFAYSNLMHRRLLIGEKMKWLFQDILKPFAGAFLACLICWLLFASYIHGVFGAILLFFIATVTFLSSALMAPAIRKTIVRVVKQRIFIPIAKKL